MNLSELKVGQKAVIQKVHGEGHFRKRILEMGFVQGKEIWTVQNAPLSDPIHYRILGYDVSLRRRDAEKIEIKALSHGELNQKASCCKEDVCVAHCPMLDALPFKNTSKQGDKYKLRVALLGNPNSGKTSLFNFVSGAHEHVGNYGGVTVDAKVGTINYGAYEVDIIDLPGAYSLSPYSPEEVYILDYLSGENKPDIILNILDASNLERNLYLTIQLKEIGLPVLVALNMFDEVERNKIVLDYPKLSDLLGTPMIPTISRTGLGLNALFDELICLWEGVKHADEQWIDPVKGKSRSLHINYGDLDVQAVAHQEFVADTRYHFIDQVLKGTYHRSHIDEDKFSDNIDKLLTHKFLGFPIFLLLMYLMFYTTFELGAIPMDWIDAGVGQFGEWVSTMLVEGSLKDLIVDGIISGVGGVIIFLPNIIILYFFISLFEDSGYMSRAAFIMDKLMNRIGLHGKSFIPLVMGFGCNVPAIMATRSIESRKSRMITMLVLPFMSCSARLPVYILIAGALFPNHSSLVLFILYLLGILIAGFVARLMKNNMFVGEEMPFVMELPPYRIPTLRSVLVQMWIRAKQYLQKMGSVILFASIVIWFLGYFPKSEDLLQQKEDRIVMIKQKSLSEEEKQEAILQIEHDYLRQRQEMSYIGLLGKTIEPALSPLGFDWKMSVSLISGLAAKEVVVSTLGVLYTGDSDDSDEAQERLTEKIRSERKADGSLAFTPLVAISFLIFSLIYFPCVATVVAVAKEAGSWKWGAFIVFFTCGLAWLLSFIVYQIGSLF